ncbi:MAG TPA: hypothetical protein VNZ04_05360 [Trinickia sp.]|nr:hypothetical protein [Trinickia sp.]
MLPHRAKAIDAGNEKRFKKIFEKILKVYAHKEGRKRRKRRRIGSVRWSAEKKRPADMKPSGPRRVGLEIAKADYTNASTSWRVS